MQQEYILTGISSFGPLSEWGKTVDEYVLENPKFQQWLDGTKLPTFKNIEQFARKFYVLLGYMFLENPPQEVFPIPFFRNIEDKGVIVTYNSVVGFNNSRPIPVRDCRGFTLVDDYAPFIFINSKDAKAAQMFTLIHEFAHVLMGYSAGVGEVNMEKASSLEQFCDKVAAGFLVPDLLFKEAWDAVGENYEVLSKRFKVSRFVLARRAMDWGFINREHFFWLYNSWINEPRLKANYSQGGNFYPSAIKKSSRTFLIHVNNALNRNLLLHMDAYRLTGLKGDTFHKILSSPFFV